MARRAILHIGTYKTGSTSIQAFLDNNAARLRDQGVYFPFSPGRPNHHGLTVVALSDRETTGLIRYLDLEDKEKREARRAEFAEALTAELASLPDDVATVVFSNEHLCGLNTTPEIERVKELLAPHFGRIEILVYLRRQDQRIISDYTQKVRDGYTKALDLLAYEPAERRNYEAFLDKWAGVFGREAIRPRIFDRSKFQNGDLIDDFAGAIGVAPDEAFIRPPAENLGLSHEAIAFLRAFNEHVPHYKDGSRNLDRMRLLPFLREGFGGDGVKTSRAKAAALLDMVRESNASLGSKYFGGGDPFSSDLSRYADEEPPEPTFDDAVRIAAFLWMKQSETINELKAENERRVLQLAAVRSLVVASSEAARALAERILAGDPDADAYYPTLLDAFVALHGELRAARRGIAPARVFPDAPDAPPASNDPAAPAGDGPKS
ncbi:MAG: hypothetical protein HXY21_00325 [Parvularculaceae bacterium]|nr:hypothetical protein [Parvularculaceae bacterium]